MALSPPSKGLDERLLSKLTYANVVATLCLFLILGGGAAFAAGKLGKTSVGAKQLKNNAVTAAKIKNGAVGGAKIDVGSLGTVPSATKATTADSAKTAGSATSAANAQAVNGRTITTIAQKIAKGTTATIATVGPFSLSAAAAADNFLLSSNAANTDGQVSVNGPSGAFFEFINGAETISLDKNGPVDNPRGIATIELSQDGGVEVLGTLGYEDPSVFGQPVCFVHGTLIS